MKRPASLVVGLLLLVMAAAQAGRFIIGLNVTAEGVEIPVWISAVAAVALAVLGIWLLKERNSH
jgi:membrane protein implicated in regulation of membrane protease activity